MSLTSNRRNFLVPAMVIAIAAVSFFAGRYSNKVNDDTSGTTDTTKCGPCMGYNNVNAIADSKLDINLLKVMALKYQIPLSGTETNSVWFSLDKIKKFINQIEGNACSTCPERKLGIRIYYGRYPVITAPPNNPFTDLDGLTPAYTNIHSVFMIPTFDKGVYHYDFDPAVSCNEYVNDHSYLPVKSDSLAIYMAASGGSITALMAMNHGDACPPPISGTSCPAIGAYFSK